MTLSAHIRFTRTARRPRSKPLNTATIPPQNQRARQQVHQHPAMQGLVVSRVHGNHCICHRCITDRPDLNERPAAA
jgi:hypothetical protein